MTCLSASPSLELRSYSQQAETHHHDHHQLVLPVEGELVMNIAGQEGEVCAQQAAVIAARRDHGFNACGNNCFVVVDVPELLAPELKRLPTFIPVDGALNHYIRFLQQQLQQETSAGCRQQMLLLLIRLLQERFSDALPIDQRIAAVREHIDNHFEQSLSLAQLATIAHLSPRQLSDLFRRYLGMTPGQYLLEKRMQRAGQLLETSSLSVQQVADQVGYNSLAGFSDRFRQYFGHSPRHFRRIGK